MSDAGVEEKLFAKGGDEQGVDDVDDSDDDLEQTEAEMPTEAEPGTDSSQGPFKEPKEEEQRVFGGKQHSTQCSIMAQTPADRVYLHP